MRRLLLLLTIALALAPRALLGQQAASVSDPVRLTRIISTLRLRAMLRPAAGAAVAQANAVPSSLESIPVPARPAVRFTGRSVHTPIAGPLDLRAAMSWWSTGLRASVSLALVF